MKRTILALSVVSLTLFGCTSAMNTALPPGHMSDG